MSVRGCRNVVMPTVNKIEVGNCSYVQNACVGYVQGHTGLIRETHTPPALFSIGGHQTQTPSGLDTPEYNVLRLYRHPALCPFTKPNYGCSRTGVASACCLSVQITARIARPKQGKFVPIRAPSPLPLRPKSSAVKGIACLFRSGVLYRGVFR
jgi:hypothetical protein